MPNKGRTAIQQPKIIEAKFYLEEGNTMQTKH